MFSCSEAVDTIETADRSIRLLHHEGTVKKFFLSGPGVPAPAQISDTTPKVQQLAAIDRCPIDYTKKLLENHGHHNTSFIRVSNYDIYKGKTSFHTSLVEK